MLQLGQAGLDRTRKQASIKRGIDEGLQTVQVVRGIVDKAVQAAPAAAVAWVGVCFGIEVSYAIQDQTRQQEKRHQDDEDKQCLEDLCETDPRDDKTRIQDTKGGLLRNSYRWILDHGDFRKWHDDPQSQLLWIKGDPGKGKTMLQKESGNRLSYFFCQATEARLSNATAVLRGLIYLLVDEEPSLISHVRKRYDYANRPVFEDMNAWEALSKILDAMLEDPGSEGTVLIIGALDECTTNRLKLLDLIAKPSFVSNGSYPAATGRKLRRDWTRQNKRSGCTSS
ncbi:hypothetical protein H9Q74_009702 [Fusarium xylarioides]|nr:hypothetical protein H9Q74_009702 [Fusarium xylarioides]